MDDSDSDREMFLTSSEYKRILNIETECRKQIKLLTVDKQSMMLENQRLNKELDKIKQKENLKEKQIKRLGEEIGQLMRGKLIGQNDIRKLEQELKTVQKENEEMKEQVKNLKTQVESRQGKEGEKIKQMEKEIDQCRCENISLKNKLQSKVKQLSTIQSELMQKINILQSQYSDLDKKATYFKKKSQQLQSKLTSHEENHQKFQKQNQRLSMINEELSIKFKEDFEYFQNNKKSLEQQIKIIKEQEEGLINQKDFQLSKLKCQVQNMSQLLIEANGGVVSQKKEISYKKQQKNYELFSSKIYKALEWVKDGVIQTNQLKQQIDNIMMCQNGYETIIKNNNERIKQLQGLLKLFEIGQKPSQQRKQQDKLTILLLHQQLARTKEKLATIIQQSDQSFKNYNSNTTQLQQKLDNISEHLRDSQDKFQALRISQSQETIEIKQALQLFYNQLQIMKTHSVYLNENQVMDTLYGILPKYQK